MNTLIGRYMTKDFGDDFLIKELTIFPVDDFKHASMYQQMFIHLPYILPAGANVTCLIMISVPVSQRNMGICTSFIKWLEKNCKSDYLIIGPIMSDELFHIVTKKLQGYKGIPPFSVIKSLK